MKKNKVYYLTFSKSNAQCVPYLKKILGKKFDFKVIACNSVVKKFLNKDNIQTQNCFNSFSENFEQETTENKKDLFNSKNSLLAKNALIKLLKFLKVYEIKNFIFFFFKIYNQYLCAYLFFLFNRIDILITPGDRECIQELTILKLCKKKGIPTIIYSGISFPGEAKSLMSFEFRKKHVICKKKNKNFIKKYKNQIKYDKKISVSFYGYHHTIIYDFLGILPNNPWIIGGGNSDYIFLESTKLVDKNFFNLKKIIITGSEATDKLKKNLKQKKYYLNKDKLNILINIINWYEHGELSFEKHFIKIDDILNNFFRNIRNDKNYNFLISLHPKQEYKNYKYLEKKFKVKISNYRSFEIIPEIDALVSIGNSSITTWCEYLNIPFYILSERTNRNNYFIKKFKNGKIFNNNNFSDLKNINLKKIKNKNKLLSLSKNINKNYEFKDLIIRFLKNKIDNIKYNSL